MLTPEQLEALRALPLAGMPNKVDVALTLAKAKQSDIIKAYEDDLDSSSVHRVVNGKYTTLDLELARKFAAFFGCQIEDLFPSRLEAPAR
jgi:DNA-binding XRE family transcriptional regulator